MRKKPSVVILYNLPRPEAGAPDRFVESDMGVLDEVAGVAEALDSLGIKWRKAGVNRLQDVPAAIRAGDEEVVFNLVEGFHARPSDMVLVPSVARALGRGVTGSDTPCLALALDKWLAKGVLSAEGLPCPKGVMVPKGRKIGKGEFTRRVVIVKPTHSDASEGIDDASVVTRRRRGACGGGEESSSRVRAGGGGRGVHRRAGAQRFGDRAQGTAGGAADSGDTLPRLRRRAAEDSGLSGEVACGVVRIREYGEGDSGQTPEARGERRFARRRWGRGKRSGAGTTRGWTCGSTRTTTSTCWR